ncbi:MAG: acyl-CoA dehydrogenase family protein [Legionellaceae bacterium]|nr:acyl-CoA dehydrogenase family protein [Legionellaceae bacterium]
MDDLLDLDDQLQDEERMIRDSVACFVKQDVLPVITSAFKQAQFPREFIKKTAEHGLLGLTLPVQYSVWHPS